MEGGIMGKIMIAEDDVKIAQKDGTKGSRVQFKEILGVGVQFNF